MSDELGRAELGLGADLKPLEADLKNAEARVAASVAVMQKMLDSLHADLDFKAKALEAAAARMASAGVPVTGQSSGSSTVVGGRNEIWGVRGPEHPGSLQNPLVTVMAAGKYFPMGSYAAAVGDSNQTDAQGSQNTEQSGLATSAEIAALTAAIHDLAQNASPGRRMAVAGAAGLGEPNGSERVTVSLEDQDSQALRDMAAALARLESRGSGGHTVFVDHGGGANRTIIAGPTGSGGHTIISGPPGEQTVRIDGGQYAGLISAMLTGGSGGGGRTILARGPQGDYTVTLQHLRAPQEGGAGGALSGAALAKLLGFGTAAGIAGFAGVGTLGSFAGLGFEHLLTLLLGIGGSATSALGGGGLLALGALGQSAVGAGSNAAVMKSTISDTQALGKAMQNLEQATAEYGKNSQQAASAQAQLNFQIKELGGANAPGVKAEMQLAQAVDNLNTAFDKLTQGGRVQAVNILMQAVQAGARFLPLVAQAAERNLAIINQDIRPLFNWLEGPQGIQIFNDLENHFAHDLPTAIHAFDQAVELVLRVVDLASGQTGGFIASLDHLATRLNNMDNAQLSATISRLIGDFRLWEHFLKLLVIDIYDLFHQDVGTGNSIIAALTGMLQKLHEYETSARGSAEIKNIFMVHKTEVLDLIKILGLLAGTFTHIYMDVAPALVTAMNDAVLPVLKAIASVIDFIAGKSQVLGTLMGLALILSKAGGIGAVAGLGRFLVGAGGGTAAGAAGAAAVGGATAGVASGLPGLVERGALGLGTGLEAIGAGGAASAVVGAGGAVSAALPVLIPAVVTAVGAYFVAHDLLGLGKAPTATATPGHLQLPGGTPGSVNLGRGAGVLLNNPSTTGLSSDVLNVKSIGDFANYSATQLAQLIAEMKKADGLKLNGVNVPKQQLIQLAEAALKVKQDWNTAFNQAWEAVNTFYRNTSRTLPALYDDFNSNMRLIAHTMGVNSETGRRLVAQNITGMVQAVQAGMLNGHIKVSDGMRAIDQALQTGMQDGAVTWDTNWKTMFATATQLYSDNKITFKQYLSDLRRINKDGTFQIQSDTQSTYKSMFANLKQQYDDGLITQGQFNKNVHSLNQSLNSTEQTDMQQFAGQIALQFANATGAGATGLHDLWVSVNNMLKLLGAPPLSALQVSVMNNNGNIQQGTFALPHGSGTNVGAGIPGHATGAVVRAPMVMVGEEAPRHPEVVIASNPAYRQRNLGLWAVAGRMLGVPGFAQGGVLNYGQLEQLWMQGGGPASVASTAAAIALAESGGQDIMQQGQPFDKTGWGYWQITPGGPQYLDPLTNARTAVAKWRGAGDRFTPWTTFVDGAYRAFLRGGVPPQAALAAMINAPGVKGHGVFANLLRSAMSKTAGAANAYLSRFSLPTLAGGGGGVPSHRGKYTFPLPAGTWTAGSVDQGWDLSAPGGTPLLAIANGQVVGHGIGGFGPWAPILKLDDGTEVYYGHAGPAGELPIGTRVTAGQTIGTVGPGIVGISTGPHLEIGFYPPGVMGSGAAMKHALGYAQGGIIGSLGMAGSALLGGLSGNVSDPISAAMNTIAGLIGPDGNVSKTTDLMSFWQGMWGLDPTVSGIMSGGPTAAIITNPATGAQSIDQASVNTAIARLTQEVGWESSIVGDLNRALTLSQLLPPKIRQQIKQRQEKIAAIKKKILENIKRINELHRQINTEQRKKKPNWHAIATWRNQILGLETENYQLGGNKTAVGTGGDIGTLTGQVSTLQQDLQTVTAYPDQIGGASGSGLGGQLGPAKITLAQLSQELGALSPQALSAALAAAQANGQSGGANQSALVSLLEQQNEILANQYAVSQAQYSVLSGPTFGLPPFGGSFANGGVVPGFKGQPRTIIAHGGEVVSNGVPNVNVNVADGMGWLKNLIQVEIAHAGRAQSNFARRQLPGRPGALLPG